AHAKRPVPPLGAGFADELDGVMKRAMAKRPDDRYPTALEFAAALRSASGLAVERPPLPPLDESIRDDVVTRAPQPIAEAVAAYEAATNPHQAQAAVVTIVRVTSRYMALVALACRTRTGPGPRPDASALVDQLRKLHGGELDDREWIELAREICRPF